MGLERHGHLHDLVVSGLRVSIYTLMDIGSTSSPILCDEEENHDSNLRSVISSHFEVMISVCFEHFCMEAYRDVQSNTSLD